MTTSKRRPIIDTACALAASALLIAFTASVLHIPASDPRRGYEPCVTEDSIACYWDADVQGNGIGDSFTTDANDVVTYWED